MANRNKSQLYRSIDNQRYYYPEHTSLVTDTYYKKTNLIEKGKKRYEDISRNTSNIPMEHVVKVNSKLNKTIDSFYLKKKSYD